MAPTKAAPMTEAPGSPAELLLVEDNGADVVLARETFRLAKLANRLTVAGDGEEALRILRRHGDHQHRPTPDLVLLDLNLPGIDGREVLAALKGDPALDRIPVIVMAGSGAEIALLKNEGLAADGFVVKPIDFERLRRIVESIESLWFTVTVRARAVSCE